MACQTSLYALSSFKEAFITISSRDLSFGTEEADTTKYGRKLYWFD